MSVIAVARAASTGNGIVSGGVISWGVYVYLIKGLAKIGNKFVPICVCQTIAGQ